MTPSTHSIEDGHGADARDHHVSADLVADIGMRRILLLSNNPDKRRDPGVHDMSRWSVRRSGALLAAQPAKTLSSVGRGSRGDRRSWDGWRGALATRRRRNLTFPQEVVAESRSPRVIPHRDAWRPRWRSGPGHGRIGSAVAA
ncbi:hypothetical protein ACFVJ5_27455 [Nocardia sp. NPDC127606]|uniref:hypothetical protein n=1 Tax=Nocardia sp. NPDC127606 TaxID=3345406 RepID=UPI003638D1F0